jgi:hypothetical protein
MEQTPPGMQDISTTYQRAYQTLDGNAQVRKIGDRLWEILARGKAAVYEKSEPVAVERGFQLAAAVSRREASRRKRRRR